METSVFALSPHTRLLFIAPHPDDESLAAGGLLQHAISRGAKVRVLFVSDGENNPWPQRFLERRWRIDSRDRAAWGTRRREEARAALRCLGVAEDAAEFLGLPDQGSTAALLRMDETALAGLLTSIEEWRPTLLVGPSIHDVHPDHNALAVLISLALERVPPADRPKAIHYVVHFRGDAPCDPRLTMPLSPEECARKRNAILCHASQMVLSQRRFLAYARPVEAFHGALARIPDHPIASVQREAGALCIRIRKSPWAAGHGDLLVAFESPVEGSVRWRIPLARRSARRTIRDAVTGAPVRFASLRTQEGVTEVRLPLARMLPMRRLFIKFDRRFAFYDAAGWLEIPVSPIAPTSCSAPPPSAIPSSSSSFAPSFSGGASASSA